MKLIISNVICRLGKISNNTIMMGGNNFQPEFTIPFSGIMLDEFTLNKATGDTLTFRSWYNHSPPALPTPCDWWAISKGEYAVTDELEGDWLCLRLAGDRMLEFFAEEADKSKKGSTKIPAYRITKGLLVPRHGGLTEFKGSLHVRPGIGKENLLLQEHQHAEVRLSFSETKPSERSEKQTELDLEQPSSIGTSIVEFHRSVSKMVDAGVDRAHADLDKAQTSSPEDFERKMREELEQREERAFGPDLIDGTGR